MSINTRLIERIQKLLSLATSPEEHEARLAAAKANELLIRHNLSAEDIQIPVEDKYENREVAKFKVFPYEARWAIKIISKHFFVKPVFREARRFKVSEHCDAKVWFVGEKTNVQVASYVFQFLVQKYKQLWQEYRKTHDLVNDDPITGRRNLYKGSYYEGLTIGLDQQLTEQRKNVETAMALMVIEDPNLATQLELHHPKLRSAGMPMSQADRDALQRGYQAGKNLRIARGIEQKSNGPVQLGIADQSKQSKKERR